MYGRYFILRAVLLATTSTRTLVCIAPLSVLSPPYFTFLLFRCSQQVMDLVKVLQEKLIEEKLKMQTSKVTALEKVFQGIEKQLVSFENACR